MTEYFFHSHFEYSVILSTLFFNDGTIIPGISGWSDVARAAPRTPRWPAGRYFTREDSCRASGDWQAAPASQRRRADKRNLNGSSFGLWTRRRAEERSHYVIILEQIEAGAEDRAALEAAMDKPALLRRHA